MMNYLYTLLIFYDFMTILPSPYLHLQTITGYYIFNEDKEKSPAT